MSDWADELALKLCTELSDVGDVAQALRDAHADEMEMAAKLIETRNHGPEGHKNHRLCASCKYERQHVAEIRKLTGKETAK